MFACECSGRINIMPVLHVQEVVLRRLQLPPQLGLRLRPGALELLLQVGDAPLHLPPLEEFDLVVLFRERALQKS